MAKHMTEEQYATWLEGLVEEFDITQFKELMGALGYEIKRHGQQGATEQEWKDAQAMCVMEEAGEFIGEYRRMRGFARRAGDREAMLSELSDVIIASMLMFYNLNSNPEEHIRAKLKKIVTRGYVNKEE